MERLRRRLLCSVGPAVLVIATLAPTEAAAGDVTVFLASASPQEVWAGGYGGALSFSFFGIVAVEGEIARLPGEREDQSITSFMASAHLAPSVGRLVPYGGLGVGAFRESRMGESDTGSLTTFILGLRLNLGLIVLKGEYRRIDLSGEPLLPLEHRVSFGGGIRF